MLFWPRPPFVFWALGDLTGDHGAFQGTFRPIVGRFNTWSSSVSAPKQLGRDYSSKTVISSMAKRKFTAKPAMLNNVFNRAGISQIHNKTTPNSPRRVRASSRRPCNPRRRRLIRTWPTSTRPPCRCPISCTVCWKPDPATKTWRRGGKCKM